jgi:hypothetical protein
MNTKIKNTIENYKNLKNRSLNKLLCTDYSGGALHHPEL